MITTDALAVTINPTASQLDLAAVVFTKARAEDGVLELSATVESDPPVEVTLVDQAGQPVTGASIARQMERYDAGDRATPACGGKPSTTSQRTDSRPRP